MFAPPTVESLDKVVLELSMVLCFVGRSDAGY